MSRPVQLDAAQLKTLHAHDPLPFFRRLAIFSGLYAVAAFGAVLLPWYAALPCALLCAAALHGISLFTHEAVHGVLFRNRLANHIFGALCAWPVLQNFAAYRVLHLRHHAQLGVEGDPDHFENYTRRRWLVYGMHWGRLLLGYPAYLVAIPVLAFRHGTARDRVLLSLETMAAAGLLVVACLTLPTAWIVHAWLIPMAFINTMVNIRGMSQHTLLEQSADVVQGTRTILTNPVTQFFMCNENFHLEHHLYPGVPWYRLPALHTALRPQLDALDAPFITSYAAFARDFVQATVSGGPRNTVTLR